MNRSPDSTQTLLARSPLFAGLGEGPLDSIAKQAKWVEFQAGVYLFEHGESADAVYILQQGVVALEMTRQFRSVTIETLHVNEVLGLSWMNIPRRWVLDARAVEPVSALLIPADFLKEFCNSDHESGYLIMKNLAGFVLERLHAARLLLLDIYSSQNPGGGG